VILLWLSSFNRKRAVCYLPAVSYSAIYRRQPFWACLNLERGIRQSAHSIHELSINAEGFRRRNQEKTGDRPCGQLSILLLLTRHPCHNRPGYHDKFQEFL
jgi:hypothetical protein